MANFKPNEMAVFLRRCAAGVCDDSCPCADVHMDCDEELMRIAADVLEEATEDD